jgi:hypothetical protein
MTIVNSLGIFGLRAGVIVHGRGPLKEANHLAAFAPHDSPELEEADVLHLDARVGFKSPLEVRTTPRSEVVTAGGVPQEADDLEHISSLQFPVLGSQQSLAVLHKPQDRNPSDQHRHGR